MPLFRKPLGHVRQLKSRRMPCISFCRGFLCRWPYWAALDTYTALTLTAEEGTGMMDRRRADVSMGQ